MLLSPDEQQRLRAKARKELKRLDTIYSDPTVLAEIEDFKNMFIKCECTYKIILAEHQFHRNKKKTEHLKIDMTQAPYALKFAGYTFDRSLLALLFGAETQLGKRSVKKLRDSFTHKPTEKDLNELRNRKKEIYGCMNEFLRIIRTYK